MLSGGLATKTVGTPKAKLDSELRSTGDCSSDSDERSEDPAAFKDVHNLPGLRPSVNDLVICIKENINIVVIPQGDHVTVGEPEEGKVEEDMTRDDLARILGFLTSSSGSSTMDHNASITASMQ